MIILHSRNLSKIKIREIDISISLMFKYELYRYVSRIIYIHQKENLSLKILEGRSKNTKKDKMEDPLNPRNKCQINSLLPKKENTRNKPDKQNSISHLRVYLTTQRRSIKIAHPVQNGPEVHTTITTSVQSRFHVQIFILSRHVSSDYDRACRSCHYIGL